MGYLVIVSSKYLWKMLLKMYSLMNHLRDRMEVSREMHLKKIAVKFAEIVCRQCDLDLDPKTARIVRDKEKIELGACNPMTINHYSFNFNGKSFYFPDSFVDRNPEFLLEDEFLGNIRLIDLIRLKGLIENFR